MNGELISNEVILCDFQFEAVFLYLKKCFLMSIPISVNCQVKSHGVIRTHKCYFRF